MPSDAINAPFWHIAANPYAERAYDWESWAADDWHAFHWAPPAVQRVTDGVVRCRVFGVTFLDET